jgi:DNA-binding NarL/FixJ family response regulator
MYDAEAARAHNRPDSATLWAGAAERSAEAGLAWDEAYAWWRAAEAGLQSSTASLAAKDHLRRAHRMATDLEANPLLNEIHALAHQARIPLDTASALEQCPIPVPGLTRREQEVLTLVMAGRTYAEIAAELVISEKTVSPHISHMLSKTNTSSRLELAQLARRLSATASPANPTFAAP